MRIQVCNKNNEPIKVIFSRLKREKKDPEWGFFLLLIYVLQMSWKVI